MKRVDKLLRELEDARSVVTCNTVKDYTTTIEKYRKLLSLERKSLNVNRILLKELESNWKNKHLCGYVFTKEMKMNLRKEIRFQKKSIASLDKVFQEWCNRAYTYLENKVKRR